MRKVNIRDTSGSDVFLPILLVAIAIVVVVVLTGGCFRIPPPGLDDAHSWHGHSEQPQEQRRPCRTSTSTREWCWPREMR